MFGDGPEVDPKELDSDTIKEMWAEARKAREEAAKREGRPVVADKTIIVFQITHCSQIQHQSRLFTGIGQCS